MHSDYELLMHILDRRAHQEARERKIQEDNKRYEAERKAKYRQYIAKRIRQNRDAAIEKRASMHVKRQREQQCELGEDALMHILVYVEKRFGDVNYEDCDSLIARLEKNERHVTSTKGSTTERVIALFRKAQNDRFLDLWCQ